MIRKFVNRYQEAQRKKSFDRRAETVRLSFTVTERGGRLWLLHDNVAFMEITPDISAEGISQTLETARTAAIEFENYGDESV